MYVLYIICVTYTHTHTQIYAHTHTHTDIYAHTTHIHI